MTKKEVSQQIFCFGIVPMLLVRKKLEEKEDYENAKIVCDTLKEHCELYDIGLPTNFGIKAKRFMVESFKELGLRNFIAVNNIESYAEEIAERLEIEI